MAAVQMHALRLFKELGYHETTVEQIAEAAEISPSTFFSIFFNQRRGSHY
ncbi:helix-turn-helix domain-containing protein [Paenibacillus sp. DMB20]